MITWERFMTVRHIETWVERRIVTPTAVVDMDVTAVAMAKGSNVKIC